MGFFEIFGYVLAFFYAIVPNLGIAIILLTITVMLLMFPLTAKQAKSMVEMQRLQPEIKRLQQKYRGDRQKLNEEMMKLYQEHKVNPLGGCLPLVVQMPVFIALFQVLRRAYEFVPEGSQLYSAFCNDTTRQMCKDSDVLPNHLTFLGMDLSVNATDVSGGFIEALPYFILVGLVVLTGYVQSRQSQRNNPQATGPAATITKVLPVLFGVFSLQFPAGLVLYFLTSNMWRLGQQELIMRKIAPRSGVSGSAAPPAPTGGDGADGKGTGGGLLSRLMAAQSPDAGGPEANTEPAGDAGADDADTDADTETETKKEPPPAPPSGGSSGGSGSAGPSSRSSGRSRARRKKRKRR